MEQYLGLSSKYTCTLIHTKTWEILGTRVSGLDEMKGNRSLGVSAIQPVVLALSAKPVQAQTA